MKITKCIYFLFLSLCLIEFLQCSSKKVIPWMCLERCGGNSTTIKENLAQLQQHKDVLTAVSFEKYNLGPNSTLIVNNLTDPSEAIAKIGLERWPMVSSYPYPPSFLDWMRTLFKNPDPFVDNVLSEMNKNNYVGINIDFEPTASATSQDAADYVDFLNYFTKKLHTQSKRLSVDIASWNEIWDWNLLGKSSVDTLVLMSTYTGNDTTFLTMLDKAVNTIGRHKITVGMECDLSTPLTVNQLMYRFSIVQQLAINEIGIWKMQIPEIWWPFINHYINS